MALPSTMASSCFLCRPGATLWDRQTDDAAQDHSVRFAWHPSILSLLLSHVDG